MAVFRKGNAEVEVSDTLLRMARRVISKSLARTTAAMNEHTGKIFADAQAAAPVKSGVFKSSMRFGERLRPPNLVEVFIRVEDPKARFVKGRAQGGRNTVAVLIRRPMRRKVKELVVILRREMVALSENR